MENCFYLLEQLENRGIMVSLEFWVENGKYKYSVVGTYQIDEIEYILFNLEVDNEVLPIDLTVLAKMKLDFGSLVQIINDVDALETFCLQFCGFDV